MLHGTEADRCRLGPSSTLPGAGQGTVLDRVVAVVNDDLILESDVDEEQRFEEIQPYRNADGNHSRERTVRRLIDRDADSAAGGDGARDRNFG